MSLKIFPEWAHTADISVSCSCAFLNSISPNLIRKLLKPNATIEIGMMLHVTSFIYFFYKQQPTKKKVIIFRYLLRIWPKN